MTVIAKDGRRCDMVLNYSEEKDIFYTPSDDEIDEENIAGIYVVLNGTPAFINPKKFRKFISFWDKDMFSN